MKDTAQRLEESKASYAVGVPSEPGAPKTKYALFLTHGMGQPLPFQTIDQVATSLYELDCKENPKNPKPIAHTVKVGDDWLNFIELRLKSGAKAVEVHLYEGYWAPMTEGRITARNVMAFLAGAGLNALRHTKGEFKRWMFGKYPPFPTPVTSVFFLLIALATVASLVVMNSTIAIVTLARPFLGAQSPWLTDNLFVDLTTTFNIVVTVMIAFGLSLALAAHMRKPKWPATVMRVLAWLAPRMRRVRLFAAIMRDLEPDAAFLRKAAAYIRKHEWLMKVRRAWSVVTLILFGVALVVVILAGLAIPLTFYGHVRKLGGTSPIWFRSVPGIENFNARFNDVALWLAVAFAVFVVGRWTWRIGKGLWSDLENENTAVFTLRITGLFVLLLGLLALVAYHFATIFRTSPAPAAAVAQSALAWPILVAASAYIRLVLVQFVGDVAIYVMPYKLDAFTDLRREIKLRVYKVAKAVYAQEQYARVIVVGHSLGSVIAYDALNNLILEDKSIEEAKKSKSKKVADKSKKEPAKPKDVFLDVVKRTPLFLTFGCPLDKTAFVFAVQPKGTSEAREALAGSVQPLIQSYKYRPQKWINVWSAWDIISGPLDLYDLPRDLHKFPPSTIRQRVHNIVDRDATTLLMAHTEYWKNARITETIYDEIKAL